MERVKNLFRIIDDECRKCQYVDERTLEKHIRPLINKLNEEGFETSPFSVGERRALWYIYRKKSIIGEVDGANMWLQSYDHDLSRFAERYHPPIVPLPDKK